MEKNKTILIAENLSYKPKRDDLLAYHSTFSLNNISLSIYENEILGLTGKSGSGKTILVKLLCNILKPESGNIQIFIPGKNNMQILFQNSIELINPNKIIKSLFEDLRVKITEIESIFHLLNLNIELLESKGSQLSGGERQRIGLARLLLVKPKILFLDEPFSSQDSEATKFLLNVIRKLRKEYKITSVIISHDLEILREITDRIIIIESGKIIEDITTRDFFSSPKHSYTKHLISEFNKLSNSNS
jgi:ABC-type dipeptide/oligopeptide/nickel transport system ATPase subunit